MARPYMTFDSLFETINLQNAIYEQSHKNFVENMSTNKAVSKRKSNGVFIERRS